VHSEGPPEPYLQNETNPDAKFALGVEIFAKTRFRYPGVGKISWCGKGPPISNTTVAEEVSGIPPDGIICCVGGGGLIGGIFKGHLPLGFI
jgi:hypothetical protein